MTVMITVSYGERTDTVIQKLPQLLTTMSTHLAEECGPPPDVLASTVLKTEEGCTGIYEEGLMEAGDSLCSWYSTLLEKPGDPGLWNDGVEERIDLRDNNNRAEISW